MPPYDFSPIQRLAVPAVCFLISFLGYTSQYLFYHISPGHLSNSETLWFNGLILCIWWCYYNTVTIDPGPQGWVREFDTVAQGKKNEDDKDNEGVHDESDEAKLRKGLRWCKKCEAVKPPRAHHCRACGRCIPKMDHHCPWTQNCVSHTTFPHFLRFVFYCVISLSLLEYHLFIRLSDLWSSRNLPAYLGPPVWAMAHLLVLTVMNSTALFALSILLVRAIYSLAINTTVIESWEIERHEALVQRSKKNGGWTYASGGQKIHIRRQEFPYDIGIWTNVVQGMGTSNILAWILPFGGGPSIQSAGNWEVNGFEEEHVIWPPIDPDKMPRTAIKEASRIYEDEQDEIAAFKKRQEKDYRRWNGKVEEDDGFEELEEYESDEYEYEEGIDGEEGWTNSDGDRLRDFGVDEEAEVLADDDIPLGELLRRRKARNYNFS